MHRKGVGVPGEGKVMDRVLDELDLTSGQKDQLHEQKKEQMVRVMDLRKEMKEQKDELKVLLHAKKTDRAKIDQVIDGISKTSEKMIRTRVDGILGVKEVLTPEQFEEFQDIMEQTREKRKKMKGKRKGSGGRRWPEGE